MRGAQELEKLNKADSMTQNPETATATEDAAAQDEQPQPTLDAVVVSTISDGDSLSLAGIHEATFVFSTGEEVPEGVTVSPSSNAIHVDSELPMVIEQVGVAVDTERGLVVPSIRNADQLSISEIARELASRAESVRDGKFQIADLRGSTFTISNLGAIGGTYSTPIINVPEVAILLIGRSRKMPVVFDDEIKIRLMMPLSLSYDHRLVDGGAAARFLNEVMSFLTAPSRLLLAP